MHIEHVTKGPPTLGQIRRQSKELLPPNYPQPKDRYRIEPEAWAQMAPTGVIDIPDNGPWHIASHPWRARATKSGGSDPLHTNSNPKDGPEVEQWRQAGKLITSAGLLLHPLAEIGFTQELHNGEAAGMFTGPGQLRLNGANPFAQFGVRRVGRSGPEYLLYSTGNSPLKLPGDHHSQSTRPDIAAREHAQRKTGMPMDLLQGLRGVLVTSAPSLFGPNTATSWLEPRTLFVDAERESDVMRFSPEAKPGSQALWLPIGNIATNNSVSRDCCAQIEAFEKHLATGNPI